MQQQIVFLKEAEEDFKKLDGSQRILVRKTLKKVRQNPSSQNEGGYGKMLGNDLSGFLKI